MKVITLVPVKNEAWILPFSLQNYSSFSDHIIVADQGSTDDSVAICNQFDKVHVVQNPYIGHTNKMRWLLLDEARKIDKNALIVYIDADEFISPAFIEEILTHAKTGHQSIGFSSYWIQITKDYEHARGEHVWTNNIKKFAFFDNETIDYNRQIVTDDHSSRIPDTESVVHIESPLLHLQFLSKPRSEIKQALYMCNELLRGDDPRKINNKYSVSQYPATPVLTKTKSKWFRGIHLPPLSLFVTTDTQKEQVVIDILNKHGVTYFESLAIWQIDLLHTLFINVTKREPRVRTYPKLLIKLNNFKNKMKYKYAKSA
jgi:glycosyltransferase involved in cell wall biosynthesis